MAPQPPRFGPKNPPKAPSFAPPSTNRQRTFLQGIASWKPPQPNNPAATRRMTGADMYQKAEAEAAQKALDAADAAARQAAQEKADTAAAKSAAGGIGAGDLVGFYKDEQGRVRPITKPGFQRHEMRADKVVSIWRLQDGTLEERDPLKDGTAKTDAQGNLVATVDRKNVVLTPNLALAQREQEQAAIREARAERDALYLDRLAARDATGEARAAAAKAGQNLAALERAVKTPRPFSAAPTEAEVQAARTAKTEADTALAAAQQKEKDATAAFVAAGKRAIELSRTALSLADAVAHPRYDASVPTKPTDIPVSDPDSAAAIAAELAEAKRETGVGGKVWVTADEVAAERQRRVEAAGYYGPELEMAGVWDGKMPDQRQREAEEETARTMGRAASLTASFEAARGAGIVQGTKDRLPGQALALSPLADEVAYQQQAQDTRAAAQATAKAAVKSAVEALARGETEKLPSGVVIDGALDAMQSLGLLPGYVREQAEAIAREALDTYVVGAATALRTSMYKERADIYDQFAAENPENPTWRKLAEEARQQTVAADRVVGAELFKALGPVYSSPHGVPTKDALRAISEWGKTTGADEAQLATLRRDVMNAERMAILSDTAKFATAQLAEQNNRAGGVAALRAVDPQAAKDIVASALTRVQRAAEGKPIGHYRDVEGSLTPAQRELITPVAAALRDRLAALSADIAATTPSEWMSFGQAEATFTARRRPDIAKDAYEVSFPSRPGETFMATNLKAQEVPEELANTAGAELTAWVAQNHLDKFDLSDDSFRRLFREGVIRPIGDAGLGLTYLGGFFFDTVGAIGDYVSGTDRSPVIYANTQDNNPGNTFAFGREQEFAARSQAVREHIDWLFKVNEAKDLEALFSTRESLRQGVMQGLGQIPVTMFAGVATGGAGMFAFNALQMGTQSFDDAIRNGASAEHAFGAALLNGGFGGAIETVADKFLIGFGGADSFFAKVMPANVRARLAAFDKANPVLGGALAAARPVAEGFAMEGGTEGLQQLIQNAIAQTYNDNQKLWDDVGFSALVGGIVGGIVATPGSIGEAWRQVRSAEKYQVAVQAAATVQAAAASPEAAAAMAPAAGSTVAPTQAIEAAAVLSKEASALARNIVRTDALEAVAAKLRLPTPALAHMRLADDAPADALYLALAIGAQVSHDPAADADLAAAFAAAGVTDPVEQASLVQMARGLAALGTGVEAMLRDNPTHPALDVLKANGLTNAEGKLNPAVGALLPKAARGTFESALRFDPDRFMTADPQTLAASVAQGKAAFDQLAAAVIAANPTAVQLPKIAAAIAAAGPEALNPQAQLTSSPGNLSDSSDFSRRGVSAPTFEFTARGPAVADAGTPTATLRIQAADAPAAQQQALAQAQKRFGPQATVELAPTVASGADRAAAEPVAPINENAGTEPGASTMLAQPEVQASEPRVTSDTVSTKLKAWQKRYAGTMQRLGIPVVTVSHNVAESGIAMRDGTVLVKPSQLAENIGIELDNAAQGKGAPLTEEEIDSTVDSLLSAYMSEEVWHGISHQVWRRQWQAAGAPGSLESFIEQRAAEILAETAAANPRLVEAARTSYSGDLSANPVAALYELERMALQLRAGESTEGISASLGQKLLSHLRAIVEFVRAAVTGEAWNALPQALRERVEAAEAILSGAVAAAVTAAPAGAPDVATMERTAPPVKEPKAKERRASPKPTVPGTPTVPTGPVIDTTKGAVENLTSFITAHESEGKRLASLTPGELAAALPQADPGVLPFVLAAALASPTPSPAIVRQVSDAFRALDDASLPPESYVWTLKPLAARLAELDETNPDDALEAASLRGQIEHALTPSRLTLPEGQDVPLVTPKGEMQLTARFSVVDLDQLVPSGDPRYPAELQPRNRNTQQSREQVLNIAANFDAARVWHSPTSSDGGPTVVPFRKDGVVQRTNDGRPLFLVVSGNGRTMAAQEARRRPDVAERYVAQAREMAQAEGLSTDGMAFPLAAHIVDGLSPDDTIKLARLSNTTAQLPQTPYELADADAATMKREQLLRWWNPSEEGDALAASNWDFLRRFVQAADLQGMLRADGSVDPGIMPRVRNAMLSLLVGDTPAGKELMKVLVERRESLGLTRATEALAAELGDILRMEQERPAFALRPEAAAALQTLVEFKAAKDRGEVKSIEDFLAQVDAFAQQRTPATEFLTRLLANAKSVRAIRAVLSEYSKLAAAEDTGNLFGEPPPSAPELLQRAETVAAKQQAEATDAAAGRAVYIKTRKEAVYKRSSTQVTLNPLAATRIQEFVASLPEADVYTDPADPTVGRETDSHVTALYGIDSADPAQAAAVIAGTPSIFATLGKTSIFENEQYDVLKVDVDSPDLHALNAKLRAGTEHTSTFPDDQPHLTLAYLKKGAGKKYVGRTDFEGHTLKFDEVEFSSKDGTVYGIPLDPRDHAPVDFDAAGTARTEALWTAAVHAGVNPYEPTTEEALAGAARAMASRLAGAQLETLADAVAQARMPEVEAWYQSILAKQPEAAPANRPLVAALRALPPAAQVAIFDALEAGKALVPTPEKAVARTIDEAMSAYDARLAEESKPHVPAFQEYAQSFAPFRSSFDRNLERIAARLGGFAMTRVPFKGAKRGLEKVLEDARVDGSEPNVAGLNDVLRASLVGLDDAHVHDLTLAVLTEFPAAQWKDRFSRPTLGYRDILIQVTLPNGRRAEVQIQRVDMLAAKTFGAGHHLYEMARSSRAALGMGAAIPQEWGQTLAKNSEAFYASVEAAFRASTADRNSSSVTGTGASTSFSQGSRLTRRGGSVAQDQSAPEGSRSTGRPLKEKNLVPSGNVSGSALTPNDTPIASGFQGLSRPRITKANIADYAGNVDASRLIGRNPDLWNAFDKQAFDRDGGKIVPVAALVSHKNETASFKFQMGLKGDPRQTAADFMVRALNKEPGVKKRAPIDVLDNGDGTFTIDDGNATAQAAMLAGWDVLPVVVRGTAPIVIAAGKARKLDEAQLNFFTSIFNAVPSAEPLTREQRAAKVSHGRRKTAPPDQTGGLDLFAWSEAGGRRTSPESQDLGDLFGWGSGRTDTPGSEGAGGGRVRVPVGVDGIPSGDGTDGRAPDSLPDGPGEGGADTPPVDGGGTEGTDGVGSGTGRRRRRARGSELRERPAPGTPERNHAIAPGDALAPPGIIGKLKGNLAAIRLSKQIAAEGRLATAEEKKQLARYVGWGAIPQIFDDEAAQKARRDLPTWRETLRMQTVRMQNAGPAARTYYENAIAETQQHITKLETWVTKWGAYHDEIKALLTPDEYETAKESTVNAHFTSPEVIGAHWRMIEALGFGGGVVLEPSAGIGHYFGLMPESIADRSRLLAVELDAISGQITRQLYPEADVQVTGFQDASIPDNAVDLAITNVPFDENGPFDPTMQAAGAPKWNLHNYFFAKALQKVKPGGIIAFISTAHTMDSQASQRQWLAERADLIGAVRLPNNAFRQNAGTDVVTDIILLRKKTATPWAGAQPWTGTTTVKAASGGDLKINEYFAAHPENVLGTLNDDGSMYGGRKEMTVHPDPARPMAAGLNAFISTLPRLTAAEDTEVDTDAIDDAIATRYYKLGTLIIEDGDAKVVGSVGEPHPIEGRKHVGLARAFIAVRDTLNALYRAEASPTSTAEELDALRQRLNTEYDAYRATHGPVHDSAKLLGVDPDYYRVAGIEVEEKPQTVGATIAQALGRKKTWGKAPVFSRRVLKPLVEPTTASDLPDAVSASLGWKGTLDPDYIARLLDIDPEDATAQILDAGIGFTDPDSGLLVLREDYLSGNVRRKLAAARARAAQDPQWSRNVEALAGVQPQDVPWHDIRVRLGATWLPPQVYEQFVAETLNQPGVRVYYHKGNEQMGDSFEVDDKAVKWKSTAVTQTFGTARLDALELLSYGLNQTSPEVKDRQEKGPPVINQAATTEARETLARIREAFDTWLKGRTDLQAHLAGLYNAQFNSHVVAKFNGQHLKLPWLAEGFDLYPDKKDVVWRAIRQGRLLVAHGVGGGKTLLGTAIALERKRLGLSNKPLIVVHNATLNQFAATISQMAPTARVLVARKEDLAAGKRQEFMGKVRSGDWDAVVMAHSTFNQIPDDPDYEREFTSRIIDEIDEAIRELGGDIYETESKKVKDPTVKQLVKQKKALKEKLGRSLTRKTDDTLTFQELGFDSMIVDEIHAYKKLPFATKHANIKGIDTGTSKRGVAMLMRARWIQDKMGGKGMFTMTGTPVTNTLGESWNMVRLVAPDLIKDFGVQGFDQFVSTFAGIDRQDEMKANGKYKRVERLAQLYNLPEWNLFFRSAADVKMGDEMVVKNRPDIEGGKPTLVALPKTEPVRKFIDFVIETMDWFDGLSGKERQEFSYIPLVCFTAARAAAIDIRLVQPDAADDPGSKVNVMLRSVRELYDQTAAYRGAQVIFCDSYQNISQRALGRSPAKLEFEEAEEGDEDGADEPITGFNLYEDIRAKLVKAGVPRSEIGVITDAKTEAAREAMFAAVNEGKIRIIIGSTEKLGTGVNMQRRMIAGHHLDVPWTPAGIEQRDGRVYRQGNIHAEMSVPVKLYRYGMSDTLDAALWQLLETKERFIKQAVSGKINSREIEDSDTLLSFAEGKAVLSGAEGLARFQAQQQVQELRRLWESHTLRTGNARMRAASIQSWLNNTLPISRRVAQSEAARLAPFRDLTEETFVATLNGEEIAGFRKVADAINELVKAREQLARGTLGADTSPAVRAPLATLEVAGVPIQLEVVSVVENLGGDSKTPWRLTYKAVLPDGPAFRLFESAGYLLRDMLEAPHSAERAVKTFDATEARNRDELAAALAEAEAPFTRMQELLDAQAKLKEIEDAQRETKRPESATTDPENETITAAAGLARRIDDMGSLLPGFDALLTDRRRFDAPDAAAQFRDEVRTMELEDWWTRPGSPADGAPPVATAQPAQRTDRHRNFLDMRARVLAVPEGERSAIQRGMLKAAEAGILEEEQKLGQGFLIDMDSVRSAQAAAGAARRVGTTLLGQEQTLPGLFPPPPEPLSDAQLQAWLERDNRGRTPRNEPRTLAVPDPIRVAGLAKNVATQAQANLREINRAGAVLDGLRREADTAVADERAKHPADTLAKWKDFRAAMLQGRWDALAHFAPGDPANGIVNGKAALEIRQIESGRATAAAKRYVESLRQMIVQGLGGRAFWNLNPRFKRRMEEFTARLHLTAARLHPSGMTPSGDFVFSYFERKAGYVSERSRLELKATAGSYFDVDGRTFRLGQFDGEINGYPLYEPMHPDAQAAIYGRFREQFPELIHMLDMWIAPNAAGDRVIATSGVKLPTFNRHSLASYFGDGPYGPLPGEVAGYTPDVVKYKTLLGRLAYKSAAGTEEMLGQPQKITHATGQFARTKFRPQISGGRDAKLGSALASGNVMDIISGFEVRALEAHTEQSQREFAMRMLRAGLRPVPDDGRVPKHFERVDKDSLNRLVHALYFGSKDNTRLGKLYSAIRQRDAAAAIRAARELGAQIPDADVPALTRYLQSRPTNATAQQELPLIFDTDHPRSFNAIETRLTEMLLGEATFLQSISAGQSLMISRRVLNEMMTAYGQVEFEHWLLRFITTTVNEASVALLTMPSTFVFNVIAPNIQLLHAAFVTMLRGYQEMIFDRGNKSNARLHIRWGKETLKAFFSRWFQRRELDRIAPPEMFEGDNQMAVATGGDTLPSTWEYLKRLRIPSAMLHAVGFHNIDNRVKQLNQAAGLRAYAHTVADERKLKGEARRQFIAAYLSMPPQDADLAAKRLGDMFLFNYSNVPWWLDPTASGKAGIEYEPLAGPLKAQLKKNLLQFGRYMFNYAKLLKRHGLDALTFFSTDAGMAALGAQKGERMRALLQHFAQRDEQGWLVAPARGADLIFWTLGFAATSLLMGDDDDDREKLGRNRDVWGEALPNYLRTGGAVNVSKAVPAFDRLLRASLDFFGVEQGDKERAADIYIRVGGLPYLSYLVAGHELETGLTAFATTKDPKRLKQSWETVRDLLSEQVSFGFVSQLARALAATMTGSDFFKDPHAQHRSGPMQLAMLGYDVATSRFIPSPWRQWLTQVVDPIGRQKYPVKGIGPDGATFEPGVITELMRTTPWLSDDLPPAARWNDAIVGKRKGAENVLDAMLSTLDAEALLGTDAPTGSYTDSRGQLHIVTPDPGSIRVFPLWQQVLSKVARFDFRNRDEVALAKYGLNDEAVQRISAKLDRISEWERQHPDKPVPTSYRLSAKDMELHEKMEKLEDGRYKTGAAGAINAMRRLTDEARIMDTVNPSVNTTTSGLTAGADDRRVPVNRATLSQIIAAQPRNAAGEMIDPHTGAVLVPGRIDIGHKPNNEWAKIRQQLAAKNASRAEVEAAAQDASLYWLEDSAENRSHRHEAK